MITNDQVYNAKILIVDDQELSIRLLSEILAKAGYVNITATTDPREAIELYAQKHPDLLILDLNMPHMDGFQVMSKLKEIEGDNYLPILLISNDENQEVRFLALESGGKDFLNKPYERVEVLIRIRNLLEVRILHNQIRDQNKLLEERVKDRTQELYSTQLDVIQRLARAVEFRDSETGMHIIRMSHYSAFMAAKVGLSMEDCEIILTASPLHDIGKIGIPDQILSKPGKLTPEEWTIMKTHTTIGGELLSGSSSKYLKIGRQIALSHHEKWDGSGYPNGLKGNDIPVVGRICGLCDVFDALTSKRPYKLAWSLEDTLKEMENGRGKHFDPQLLDCFMDNLGEIKYIKEKYEDGRTDVSI